MASIERRTTAKGAPRWEVRYRVKGREISRTFRTRELAKAHKTQVEHQELIGAGYDPRGARITLADWWAIWWPSTMHLRESTRARDASCWRARIEPALGDLTLEEIDRAALRSWVAALSADGLAPATVHRCVQIVAKTLRAAIDEGRLARNPADRLELPRVQTEEMRFLVPDQIATLADAIDPAYRALVMLGAYGGLRLGEMLALKRERIDLDIRGRVEVLATLVEVNGRLLENEPKTRAGRRTVPIPRVAVEPLREHLAHVDAGGYVFTAPEGGPVWPRAWRRRAWQPACIAAGLGELVRVEETQRTRYEGLRPHDLRHSAVALWIAAGASPNEVAARAGHSSVVTVLDRYGHLLPGTADQVTDALDDLAADARPTPSATITELGVDRDA